MTMSAIDQKEKEESVPLSRPEKELVTIPVSSAKPLDSYLLSSSLRVETLRALEADDPTSCKGQDLPFSNWLGL